MPTLDHLPADKRAIIELVLRRGQSYGDIAGLLGMPESRVREHARDALVALAPRTAQRVDPEWRGQVADYVIGQQSGPEATATRGHLKRSEPARAWALSMLDSLGDLYQDGAEPEIPAAETVAPRRPSGGRRGRAGAEVPAPPREERRPSRERAVRERRPRDSAAAPEATPSGDEPAVRERRELSPAAQAVLRRRRVVGALVALVALAALIVVAIPALFGDDEQGASTPSSQDTGAQGQPRVLAQLELEPVDGGNATGLATIAEEAGQPFLIVQARLEPTQGKDAVYEVWLYNSRKDARSLGAQLTDPQGNYSGASEDPLPADFERYEFLDISREPTGNKPEPEHSGESVLRARIAGGESSPQAGGAAPPDSEAPGGTSTPPGAEPAPPSGGGGAP